MNIDLLHGRNGKLWLVSRKLMVEKEITATICIQQKVQRLDGWSSPILFLIWRAGGKDGGLNCLPCKFVVWTVLCTCFVYVFFLHPNRPFRDFLQSVHLPSSVGPSQVLINKMYSLLIQPRTGEVTIISTIIIIKSLSHLSKPQGLTICVCVLLVSRIFLWGKIPKDQPGRL